MDDGSNSTNLTAYLDESIHKCELKKGETAKGSVAFIHKAGGSSLLVFRGFSVVFWGSSYMEGGAHPTNCLYSASQEFEAVFFEKAYVPTAPKTSYDDIDFAELLKQQNSEYQIASPFSIEGNLTYFLKPDGIVFSMSAPYVLGDHFEAQMNYNDIEKFYLPEQKYWESKK